MQCTLPSTIQSRGTKAKLQADSKPIKPYGNGGGINQVRINVHAMSYDPFPVLQCVCADLVYKEHSCEAQTMLGECDHVLLLVVTVFFTLPDTVIAWNNIGPCWHDVFADCSYNMGAGVWYRPRRMGL